MSSVRLAHWFRSRGRLGCYSVIGAVDHSFAARADDANSLRCVLAVGHLEAKRASLDPFPGRPGLIRMVFLGNYSRPRPPAIVASNVRCPSLSECHPRTMRAGARQFQSALAHYRAGGDFGGAPVCRLPPRAISDGLAIVSAHNEKLGRKVRAFDGL